MNPPTRAPDSRDPGTVGQHRDRGGCRAFGRCLAHPFTTADRFAKNKLKEQTEQDAAHHEPAVCGQPLAAPFQAGFARVVDAADGLGGSDRSDSRQGSLNEAGIAGVTLDAAPIRFAFATIRLRPTRVLSKRTFGFRPLGGYPPGPLHHPPTSDETSSAPVQFLNACDRHVGVWNETTEARSRINSPSRSLKPKREVAD